MNRLQLRRKSVNVRVSTRLAAVLAVLAAAVTLPLVLGAIGGAAPPPVPLVKVLADPFEDGLGYHGSAEEPSIFAARNPARAGGLADSSTIVATEQVGRIYDGGASDIGYQVSVDGGKSWKHGELPLTMQGGVSDTCAGQLNRASDTVTVYDQKHDVWIISTLGLANGTNVPAVYVNRGIVDFGKKDIDWGPPICQHITQPAADSPDKNWITCDNWPASKGYGNCYVEYDNNGNGNRILMQVTHDSGLTWEPGPDLNTNPAIPGNGNTGDVQNETALSVAASPGDTNIRTADSTTLAAASTAGATNIKVNSVTGFVIGEPVAVDTGASRETRTISVVGTAGAGGTGITVDAAFTLAHASGAVVDTTVNIGTRLAAATAVGATNIKVATTGPFFATTLAAAANAGDTNIKVTSVTGLQPGETINIDSGATLESRVIQSVGSAGAGGTGVTLTSALGSAHANAAPVTLAGQKINVGTGGALEIRNVASVGTAGAAGTGVTLTAPLDQAHGAGEQVNAAVIRIDIDPSGGNQETVNVLSVGTAGAAGTGVDFAPALTKSHAAGAPTGNAAAPTVGRTGGIGGVPLVQPPPPGAAPGTVCGRVVVPLQVQGVSYFSSNDCGECWSATTQILPNMTATHSVAQNIRTSLLPSSAIDGGGSIYVTWQTRSFRADTASTTPNDIALSVMAAPTAARPNPPFGAPARIPIDQPNDNTNTNDHFIPGIAADANTAGATAHLGLYYYNYLVAACSYLDPENPANQCELRVGFVSSTDGGATWSDPLYLASMGLPDLVRSSQGLMVGDYSTADVIPAGENQGNAISAFAVGLTDKTLNQPMYVPKDGIPIPFSPGAHEKQNASPAAIERAREEGVQQQPNVPPSVP